MRTYTPYLLAALLSVAATATRLDAKNVDLSTIPDRASVQLTIYNSEDLTLVRETRKISFKPGMNPLQFSWQNTLIDPTSVQIRFLEHRDTLELVDTVFPHDKPHMLYWNVDSQLDGDATVEITYFTSGISWQADYVAIANPNETHMTLESFVRVTNNSGEEYEDAQVRLVVGTVNLVEKIAQLARIPMGQVAQMPLERRDAYRHRAAREMMAKGGSAYAFGAPDEEQAEAKDIIKEGLSEYFIYTIEGTETIPNGWSKRLRSFTAEDVPFKIEYRYRPREYGNRLVRLYLLKNHEDSELGDTPLPDGVVRIFRDTGKDALGYVGQQSIKYVPIGDKIELDLGVDPNVMFELVKLRAWRDNVWLHWHGNTWLYKPNGEVKIDHRSSVAGWDEHVVFSQRIRNFTDKPIKVEVRRRYNGHVDFVSQLEPKLHDAWSPQFNVQVFPGQTLDSYFEMITHQGRNRKQSTVSLITREVKP